jgi:hypothetical protein
VFRTSARNIPSADAPGGAKIVVCDRDPDGDGTFGPGCRHIVVSRNDVNPLDPHLSGDGSLVSYEVPPPVIDAGTGWIELVSLSTGADGGLREPLPGDRTVVRAPAGLAVGTAEFRLGTLSGSSLATGGGHLAFVAHYHGGRDDDHALRSAVYDYAVETAALTRLDVDTDGTPLPGRTRVFDDTALSGDGRRYAFVDHLKPLSPVLRVYDRDPEGDGTLTGEGVPLPAEVASRTTSGDEAIGGQPAFSADGRYLAFTTPSPGVHNGVDDLRDSGGTCLGRQEGGGGPTASYCDIVVRDLAVDAARAAAGLPRLPAELASPSLAGACAAHTDGATCEGTGDSTDAALTGDGSAVAFASAAPDLVERDVTRDTDVFLRRFTPTLAADPVDLGTVPLGSTALADARVRHVGFGPLAVAEATVAGADPGDFAVFPGETCTAAVLHTTGTCVVSIRFAPAAVGPRSAVVRLTPVRGVPLDIPVTGTGTPPRAGGFSASPAGLAFGARGVLHLSDARSVRVTNTGDGPLAIGAVSLAGTTPADYRITADTCRNTVVAPGGTCRIDVRHRPLAVGERPAVLRIDHSGTLSHVVTLTGSGTAPTLTPSPTVVKAGEVLTVTGADFPPKSTVTVGFAGLPAGLTVRTTADGSFTRPFVVMAHIERGQRPLVGTVVPASAPGLTGPLTAPADVLVVNGALQPPDFIFRN